VTRSDLEFALQMLQNAVAIDPNFALAYAAIANVCAQHHYNYGRDAAWMERAVAASEQASALNADLPEALVAQAWVLYAGGRHDEAIRSVRQAIERKRDCEGAYYLLGRALFAAGRYQEVAAITDAAIESSGEDLNVYVPITNALEALGKDEVLKNVWHRRIAALESHLKQVPEDARSRIHLAIGYGKQNRIDDAVRETNLAVVLRPNEASVLYNAACAFCTINRRPEALDAIRKAWDAGFKDSTWARRDPDLALLHDDPEFNRLYPAVPDTC
jgi:tetratricopeptide (TPR) repeat protein